MESEGSVRDRLGKRIVNRSFGGIICFKGENTEEEYLLVKQRHMKIWSFPKGHGHQYEDHLDAAKREIYEETGLQLKEEPIGRTRFKRGIYFVFHLQFKPETFDIRDKNEIEEVKWFSVNEMKDLHSNSGVKLFIEKRKVKSVFPTN